MIFSARLESLFEERARLFVVAPRASSEAGIVEQRRLFFGTAARQRAAVVAL